jgi:hypothetical protein
VPQRLVHEVRRQHEEDQQRGEAVEEIHANSREM